MVKPRSEEVSNEGGGSYLSIEKAMKKKKKRKNPPLDNDASNMIASNADPSLLVRVPHDNRVNVDDVLDKKLQLEVEKWGLTDSSLADKSLCGSPEGKGVIEVAPQNSYVVALSSELDVISHGNGDDTTQVVSKSPTVSPVFRSDVGGGSIGAGLVAPKPPTMCRLRPRLVKVLLCGSGVRLGAGPVPNRPNPPTPLPIRPEAVVPRAVPTGPPEGAKVRPKFSEVIKDNRIVGNGLKLQQYDFMENDDDVILDESDEIPFVET
ncbi:hypothetical protein LIER_20410 [Lithospermum erythrorhizon]|uniref:Uncharacterized protein n=1 Tax=Lithospermum erythrorhizon TaxID=34254 RepID=A0AAV3QLC2_LITER